jgi:hypothetical protein
MLVIVLLPEKEVKYFMFSWKKNIKHLPLQSLF